MAGYLPAGSPANTADVFFQMSPNGEGSLGTVNITGYVGGTSTLSQSSSVTYTASGGAGRFVSECHNGQFLRGTRVSLLLARRKFLLRRLA